MVSFPTRRTFVNAAAAMTIAAGSFFATAPATYAQDPVKLASTVDECTNANVGETFGDVKCRIEKLEVLKDERECASILRRANEIDPKWIKELVATHGVAKIKTKPCNFIEGAPGRQ